MTLGSRTLVHYHSVHFPLAGRPQVIVRYQLVMEIVEDVNARKKEVDRVVNGECCPYGVRKSKGGIAQRQLFSE